MLDLYSNLPDSLQTPGDAQGRNHAESCSTCPVRDRLAAACIMTICFTGLLFMLTMVGTLEGCA